MPRTEQRHLLRPVRRLPDDTHLPHRLVVRSDDPAVQTGGVEECVRRHLARAPAEPVARVLRLDDCARLQILPGRGQQRGGHQRAVGEPLLAVARDDPDDEVEIERIAARRPILEMAVDLLSGQGVFPSSCNGNPLRRGMSPVRASAYPCADAIYAAGFPMRAFFPRSHASARKPLNSSTVEVSAV